MIDARSLTFHQPKWRSLLQERFRRAVLGRQQAYAVAPYLIIPDIKFYINKVGGRRIGHPDSQSCTS